MKITLFIALFMLVFGIFAQDTLNQRDSEGKKQGYWIIYGKDQPQQRFPEEGKIEEGTYYNDRKHGEYKKYYNDGVSLKVKGVYENGRPNGAYEKYYQDGSLMEQGIFHRKYYIQEWTAYWENGNLKTERYFDDQGKKHGKEIFYFQNKQKELEAKYNHGILVDTLVIYYPNGDLKSMTIHDSLGTIVKDSLGTMIQPKQIKQPIYSPLKGSTCFPNSRILNGKIYDKGGNIIFDGALKEGCAWNGKHYIYSKDGLLMKIEIWKDGKYHSDGQL